MSSLSLVTLVLTFTLSHINSPPASWVINACVASVCVQNPWNALFAQVQEGTLRTDRRKLRIILNERGLTRPVEKQLPSAWGDSERKVNTSGALVRWSGRGTCISSPSQTCGGQFETELPWRPRVREINLRTFISAYGICVPPWIKSMSFWQQSESLRWRVRVYLVGKSGLLANNISQEHWLSMTVCICNGTSHLGF